MLSVPLPTAATVSFRPLDTSDADMLQALFERCSEFFVLTEGGAPGPGHAVAELESRAKGKTDEDTFCLGVFRDDRLVGFVHMTRDYPKPEEWWLGFLILDADVRGGGLGAEVHDALLSWATANGSRVMWLGVLEQNVRAERFWRRMGYRERERQVWVAPNGFQSAIILMSQP
jgi:RimJ/RimL family protein N-acetyltransferase